MIENSQKISQLINLNSHKKTSKTRQENTNSYNYDSVFLPSRMREMMGPKVLPKHRGLRLPNISINDDLKSDLKMMHKDGV
jgi:hypothetical protein